MREVFLSDLADGLEGAARDMCKHFSIDPDEDVYQFFGCIRFARWQLVAEQLIASIKSALPPRCMASFVIWPLRPSLRRSLSITKADINDMA
jgi:hypothetical protein